MIIDGPIRFEQCHLSQIPLVKCHDVDSNLDQCCSIRTCKDSNFLRPEQLQHMYSLVRAHFARTAICKANYAVRLCSCNGFKYVIKWHECVCNLRRYMIRIQRWWRQDINSHPRICQVKAPFLHSHHMLNFIWKKKTISDSSRGSPEVAYAVFSCWWAKRAFPGNEYTNSKCLYCIVIDMIFSLPLK